jgi:hypothetical protein
VDNLDLTIDSPDVHNTHSGKTSGVFLNDKIDLLIFGAPVNGFRPAKEVLPLIVSLQQGAGKKAIVFCTYTIMKGSTLKH